MNILYKIATVLFVLIQVTDANAQIIVTSHKANSIACKPSDILSVSVQNTGSDNRVGVINAILQDQNGVMLLHVKSTTLEIPVGLSSFNGSSILEEADYRDVPTAQFLFSHGQLISGQYEICFEIHVVSGENLPSMCFPVISNYNSFLQLMNPYDTEVINQLNPQLLWMHSGLLPVSHPRESFELRLVEIFDNQTKNEAIAENAFLLNLQKVQSHNLFYPVDAQKLREGHSYAWQVRHFYDDQVIEHSDVWEFEIQEWEDPRDIKYVDLTGSKNSDVVEVYNSLYVRFDERYQSDMVEVAVEDANAKRIAPELLPDSQNVLSKRNGFNGYRINLSQYHLKAGYYTVVMWNAKGDKYSIKIHFNS